MAFGGIIKHPGNAKCAPTYASLELALCGLPLRQMKGVGVKGVLLFCAPIPEQ